MSMDAVAFVEAVRRMGKSTVAKYHVFHSLDAPEDVVAEVEQWLYAHPRKTRQNEFLKQWPDTKLDGEGIIDIDPCVLQANHCDNDADCYHCRCAFWQQEVE